MMARWRNTQDAEIKVKKKEQTGGEKGRGRATEGKPNTYMRHNAIQLMQLAQGSVALVRGY
jgi:hypothetical protein